MAMTENAAASTPESTDQVEDHSEDLIRAMDRISVRRPYFGLEKLEMLAPGLVRAPVPAAPPLLPEVGLIQAAQVARHLAILGSCAAALARHDDDRHHYLAVDARYSRAAGAPSQPVDDGLIGEAIALWLDKRTARSLVTLRTESGQATHFLDVTYAVMTPRMFGRLHPTNETTDLDQLNEPETGLEPTNQLMDGRVEATPDGVTMDCGQIPTASCAGHFPGVPAAPVALVMGQLCKTAGQGLARHLGTEDGYCIEEGHVTASKLARAGQHLVLEAAYQEPVGAFHRLSGVARADGEVIGEVDVTMSCAATDST